MSSLEGRTIFLSASFPHGERAARHPPADAAAIADAVTAVTRAILNADGRIVFGAHPTISPLLLLVAGEYGREDVVEIFQSEQYRELVPPETLWLADRGFGRIHWTRDLGDSDANLALMRRTMLGRPLAAGVFVGGMSGIVDEFELLGPRAPRFVVAAPGGAARELLERRDWDPPRGFEPYADCPRYPAVAHALVEIAARHGG